MATTSTFPAPYVPRQAPTLPDPSNTYLMRELRALQDTLNGVLELLPQAVTTVPSRPRAGMVRLALAPWRPVAGQTDDRWVTYVGGAWAYLAST